LDKINVGVIGFGSVGQGVVRTLLTKPHFLQERIGARLALKVVCDRDIKRKREISLSRDILTSDVNKILHSPDIQIVVELIGGIHPAKEFILEALRRGKHVVTANKALLAECGMEIFDAARKANADLYFEASVGGGIPIIKALRESLGANHIDTLLGIVNGTSNYILSSMSEDRLSFNQALAEAKKKGYAERDPSLDIKGFDSAHKLAILTLLGLGKSIGLRDIYVEGIEDISLNDIRYAEDLGYVIKLLAIAKNVEGQLEVRVHPTLLSAEHLLSNVRGVYNAIYVHGDLAGGTLFYGRGAGSRPAASSVVSDIIDVARNITYNSTNRVPLYVEDKTIKRLRSIEEIESRYYLRLSVIDKPGCFAKIAAILGSHGISIASVVQKERRQAKIVPVVMMLHEAKEKNMRLALTQIDRLSIIKKKTIAIRVER
jgi:homoserine dehydrogenase